MTRTQIIDACNTVFSRIEDVISEVDDLKSSLKSLLRLAEEMPTDDTEFEPDVVKDDE